MLEVVLRAPRELDEFPLDAVFARQCAQDLQRFVDDIDADAVALDYRDAVLTHSVALSRVFSASSFSAVDSVRTRGLVQHSTRVERFPCFGRRDV